MAATDPAKAHYEICFTIRPDTATSGLPLSLASDTVPVNAKCNTCHFYSKKRPMEILVDRLLCRNLTGFPILNMPQRST
jgi:hypothetical protein